MPPKKKKPVKQANSSIRIIAGQWRGRKLSVGNEDGLRPTGDRLRETLFNWLAPYIHQAKCLDAFAGTGALGFEALSRGAEHVQFVEKNPRTAEHLQKNAKSLMCSAKIDTCSFTSWQSNNSSAYDLIFLDPPFQADIWQNAFEHIKNNVTLSNDAIIYVESPRGKTLTPPESWLLHKEKTIGQVHATLYKTNLHDPR